MKNYKTKFIEFLLKEKCLKFGDFKLKSGRSSPYFIDTSAFDSGTSIANLGYFYAAKIMELFNKDEFDLIFGPSYKGIPILVATVISLSRDFNINKGYCFNRKEIKNYGEATKKHYQKGKIVGRQIKNRDRILIIDDVFTTGETKYESLKLLHSLAANCECRGVIIAVDRQETETERKQSSIEKFSKETAIAVNSIIGISDIYRYLLKTKNKFLAQKIADYLNSYGTEKVKQLIR